MSELEWFALRAQDGLLMPTEGGIWPGSFYLCKLERPNLRKLVLEIETVLSPDFLVDMGRGMKNFRELNITNNGCNLRTIPHRNRYKEDQSARSLIDWMINGINYCLNIN